MSFEALNWAVKVKAGGPGHKAVLLALAQYADEAQSCFPSQALLAEVTEQGVRTIQRQLAQLEDRGLIRSVARGRRGGGRISNRYTLMVGTKPADMAGNPIDTPDQGASKPATDDDQTRHLEQPNTTPVAQEPSLNHHLEPSPEKIAATSAATDDALFEMPTKNGTATPPTNRVDPVNVAAKAIADHWHTRTNGMGNFMAVRALAVKALRAGHTDVAVVRALDALYDANVPPTAGTLLTELRGGIGSGRASQPTYRAYQDDDYWSTDADPGSAAPAQTTDSWG